MTIAAESTESRPAARSVAITWGLWTIGFVAFPLGGLAGTAVAGPVDTGPAALIGGLVTGLIIGGAQALVARRRLPALRWTLATTTGMGLGLLLGATAVGYNTSLGALAIQGALTGLVLGPAQMLALPTQTNRLNRLIWASTGPMLWALGWTVTTVAGIDVAARYTVFGATGALTYSALSGLLLILVLPRARTEGSAHTAPLPVP